MNNDESILTEKDFLSKHIVFDIIYRPLKTKLLVEAEKKGCKIITGDQMFLNQAYAQFNIFTGEEAPKTIMNEAFYNSF